MIRKRVHKLRYFEVSPGEPYQDGTGDWHQGESVKTEVVLNCRADINNGQTIKNNQGEDFVYSFAIYLNSIPDSLTRGTEIEILKNGIVVGEGKVIMPWGFQATNKLWV